MLHSTLQVSRWLSDQHTDQKSLRSERRSSFAINPIAMPNFRYVCLLFGGWEWPYNPTFIVPCILHARMLRQNPPNRAIIQILHHVSTSTAVINSRIFFSLFFPPPPPPPPEIITNSWNGVSPRVSTIVSAGSSRANTWCQTSVMARTTAPSTCCQPASRSSWSTTCANWKCWWCKTVCTAPRSPTPSRRRSERRSSSAPSSCPSAWPIQMVAFAHKKTNKHLFIMIPRRSNPPENAPGSRTYRPYIRISLVCVYMCVCVCVSVSVCARRFQSICLVFICLQLRWPREA